MGSPWQGLKSTQPNTLSSSLPQAPAQMKDNKTSNTHDLPSQHLHHYSAQLNTALPSRPDPAPPSGHVVPPARRRGGSLRPSPPPPWPPPPLRPPLFTSGSAPLPHALPVDSSGERRFGEAGRAVLGRCCGRARFKASHRRDGSAQPGCMAAN